MASGNHLRLGSEFGYMRAEGRKEVTPSFVFIFAQSRDGELRCGVICSRKFSPLAVKRNRARRLLYEAYRQIEPELEPAWILMIPRQQIMRLKCQDVEKDLRRAAGKAGLLGKDSAG